MRIHADKIASSTRNAKVSSELTLSPEIISKEGYVIAVRTLTEKNVYNTVELLSGRMSKICKGDVLVGVLGKRNALKGYSGVVPEKLAVGDTIQILNLGGVLGTCTSENVELGPPIQAEVLGSVLTFPSFQHRLGKQASIHTGKVAPSDNVSTKKPIILIIGTCMNAGKTRVACEIVKQLSARGKRVAAGKVNGISLMRDTLEMSDFGAVSICDFNDAGVVCTSAEVALPVAKGIVNWLSQSEPDCILLELGDGIMGEYGVMELLGDKELMSHVKAIALAANDQVGAWGAVNFLRGVCTIDVVCGPVTDNGVGKKFIERVLMVKAANAIKESEALGNIIAEKVL